MLVSREYIAGLFDGEGTVRLIDASGPAGRTLRPEVTITHKQTWLLETVSASLASYGVGNHLSTGTHEGVGRLTIAGLKRTKRFVDEVGPFVVLKQAELRLVGQFIARRLAVPPNTPYDGEDLRVPSRLRGLRNAGRESSET